MLAVPLGLTVRKSSDWTTFGATVAFMVVLMIVGSLIAMGPWTKGAEGWSPDDPETDPASSRLRRHDDEGEQLAFPQLRSRSRVHARH